jgi:hypothetical protein
VVTSVLRILSAYREAGVKVSSYLILDKAGQVIFFGEVLVRLPDWGIETKIVCREIELRPRAGNDYGQSRE